MTSKLIACLIYIALIVLWLMNPGTQMAQWIAWVFIALVIAHFVEFLLKKNVMQAAGGSMANHFLQTMLFGFVHWKPLERQR